MLHRKSWTSGKAADTFPSQNGPVPLSLSVGSREERGDISQSPSQEIQTTDDGDRHRGRWDEIEKGQRKGTKERASSLVMDAASERAIPFDFSGNLL